LRPLATPRPAAPSLREAHSQAHDSASASFAGLLMTYSSDLVDDIHRRGTYVPEISGGTEPGDLPIVKAAAFGARSRIVNTLREPLTY
jgi:hypothetical protein